MGESDDPRRAGGSGDGQRADTGVPDPGDAVARRDAAVAAAVAQGLIRTWRETAEPGLAGTATEPGAEVVGLLDVAGIDASVAALHAAFAEVTPPGTPVLHTFALKAATLVPVMGLLAARGMGAEVASPGEMALAGAAGVAPERTVLDSPAKTGDELRRALASGVAVNADNPQELARIDALVRDGVPRSPLGLRINPQLGAGTIGAMSTATATSKFGVGLRDEGAREWVVRAYLERPWLTRLHTHSGSQGMALDAMAEGVAEAYRLAEEINARAGRHQVDTVDIGGGLPVNFASDATTPTYAQYARLLARRVPGLFDGRYGLVTEFGRSLLAKNGFVLARVEYTKSTGGRPIAVTHAGAQVAARTVYAPESWPLRIAAYDGAGRPRTGEPVAQDVAGPACFSGDLLAVDHPLPLLEPGDLAAALDTGAYYFAHYAYNALPRPAIHGFTLDAAGAVRFATVREAQTVPEIVAESGGAWAHALTDL